MNKKSAGKVFRYSLITLVSLLGIALALPAAVGLYVRYMPYTLPEPTGKAPDVTAFIPDEASPIPLEEQRQLWVAQAYIFDRDGLYHNPQAGLRILDALGTSDNDATALEAIKLLMLQAFTCTDKIASVYQVQDWRFRVRAQLLPVEDKEIIRLYRHWQKLQTLDARMAKSAFEIFEKERCITSNPLYASTFGKHKDTFSSHSEP
jgi:hypothetical protein